MQDHKSGRANSQRILELARLGISRKAIAERVGVTTATVGRVIRVAKSPAELSRSGRSIPEELVAGRGDTAVIELDNDKDYYGLPVHPVCAMFPLMDMADFSDLAADIEEHGLINPIIIHEGQLADGRNRANACQNISRTRSSFKPEFREWREIYKGKQTIDEWIWSINVERRHLTDEQRLAVQVIYNGWKEKEAAKHRQVDAGKARAQQAAEARQGKNNGSEQLVANSSQATPATDVKPQRAPAVRTQIAQQLHMSEHKVQQALNVQKADPELLRQVSTKEITLKQAAKVVREATQRGELTKPRVFDVDRNVQSVIRLVNRRLALCPDGEKMEFLSQCLKQLTEYVNAYRDRVSTADKTA